MREHAFLTLPPSIGVTRREILAFILIQEPEGSLSPGIPLTLETADSARLFAFL